MLAVLNGYEQAIEDAKGRPLSFMERRTVEGGKLAAAAQLLILAQVSADGGIMRDEIVKTGRVNGERVTASTVVHKRSVHPAFRELGKFIGLEMKALSAIGLAPEEKPITTLREYINDRTTNGNGTSTD